MARFRIIKDGTMLLQVDLKQDKLSLGRGPENDIRLGDLTVSRCHARVVRTPDGGFAIEDAGSTNGIYLNGRHLEQSALLGDGDVVSIGVYQLEFASSDDLADLGFETSYSSSKFFVHEGRDILPANAGGVLINESNNAVFALTSGKAVIGNEGDVDIRVPGNAGVRASIMQQGAQFYICSETAIPCVRVNGTLVMNALLAYNDRLEVGSRRFIFREI